MKNKWIIVISIVLVLFVVVGVYFWGKPVSPVAGVQPENVETIEIFDGNTGRDATITKEEDMEYIIDNLSSVTMKRIGISLFRSGYQYRVTIEMKNGGSKQFIINSKVDVRKDPFFYQVYEGEIDCDYIEEILREQNKAETENGNE
ncbi:MAG: hypothetical protein IJP29_03725 [Lachnospiraceae bacterium]|nr:hypothetical protein [Lachnospiraceae bacterium]